MKRYSKQINAIKYFAALTGLALAGCQQASAPKVTPVITPVSIATTTPTPIPEFATLAQANTYVEKNVSNKRLSAAKRGENTEYFLQNVPDEIIAQLPIEKVADLYEGLTDHLPNLNNFKLFSNHKKVDAAARKTLHAFGADRAKRLVACYIKLGQTSISLDSKTEKLFNQVADNFCTQYIGTKDYAKFQNAYLGYMKTPNAFKNKFNQKEFCNYIKPLLFYNTSQLFKAKRPIRVVLDYHSIIGANVMAYSPATGEFSLNPKTFQGIFDHKEMVLFSGAIAKTAFHESLHYYFDKKYPTNSKSKLFSSKDEESLSRIIRTNRFYSFTIYQMCRDGHGDFRTAYNANPEEKIAIDWGNRFVAKYQFARPFDFQNEMQVYSVKAENNFLRL